MKPLIVCVLAGLVCLAATGLSAAEPSSRAPNVLLIISDDQAWTDFGFMGHPDIKTPHLDRLASESVLFTRGYVPVSLCRASLASIITGLYPHQHKLTSNDPPRGTDRKLMLRHMESHDTLPRWLGAKGYRSLQTGKWWEGSYKVGGFTQGMTHGDPARGGRHGDVGLEIGRQGLDQIENFIDDAGETPFFVWYAPIMPHTPHNPPARLLKKYQRDDRPVKLARYYAMCEWFDETCGALLDFLDERHLADDTIVAFVVDNGWIQEVGVQRTTRGWFAPKSKLSPYDGGLRTPIMLRWPGHLEPARRDELVSSIDLAPTILAACGVEVPSALPGVNLLDVRAGRSQGHEILFGAVYDHDATDINRPAANLAHRWCVKEKWKLIVPDDAGQQPELYDVIDDPHENKNLAAEHPDVVESLRKRLDQWWAEE
jgi:uncharacterized sulfatase